jgi:ceroid-lipofuscinosis MFS transporter 7
MLAGNVIYILMETIHVFPKRYWLMIGRFITGMGSGKQAFIRGFTKKVISGNVAILRTYASTASTLKDRTKALAFVTCGQALGLTTGPVFQLLFTPLDHPGIRFFDLLSFSLYTAPAYFACLMNIGGLVLLYFFFNEKYAGIIEEDPKTDDVEDQSSIGAQPTPTLPPYDLVAILICHATRFCDMFVRTNLETLGSPFAMMVSSFRVINDKRVFRCSPWTKLKQSRQCLLLKDVWVH